VLGVGYAATRINRFAEGRTRVGGLVARGASFVALLWLSRLERLLVYASFQSLFCVHTSNCALALSRMGLPSDQYHVDFHCWTRGQNYFDHSILVVHIGGNKSLSQ